MRASKITAGIVSVRLVTIQASLSFFRALTLGAALSWRDDLESLGYSLLYLLRGSLPWLNLEGATKDETNELVKRKKLELSADQLCEGLPHEFAEYISYTKSLGFAGKPDYVRLRNLFRRLFKSQKFKHDNVFDWTEKLFNGIHGKKDSASAQSPEPKRWGATTAGQRVTRKVGTRRARGGRRVG